MYRLKTKREILSPCDFLPSIEIELRMRAVNLIIPKFLPLFFFKFINEQRNVK